MVIQFIYFMRGGWLSSLSLVKTFLISFIKDYHGIENKNYNNNIMEGGGQRW